MNNKLNSLLSTIAITCAVGVPLSLTAVHELPVQAALTAPASYDLNYRYSSSLGRFVIGSSSVGTVAPTYSATADGVYTNYSSTLTSALNSGGVLPEGLDITMTFNRSNTSWQGVGPGAPFSLWRPNDTKIGSDTTVGSVSNKIYLKFDNQTNKNYRLILDLSSTVAGQYQFNYEFDDNVINTNESVNTSILRNYFIPSFSLVEIYRIQTGTANYFDAWYLEDLGVSASYDAGYDVGYDVGEDDGYQDGLNENPNIIINAAESLIGMFVNFTFILFSLELFGVSILSIVGVLFGIIAIVWILKTIRGG